MPATFPEVWESRVRTLLTDQIEAPWLDGIPELDTAVVEMGSGSASESNIIHIPISTFRPGVLINNNTYPIAVVAYDDTSTTVQLDKYQTKVSTLSDDQINGAAYKQIDSATKGHVDDILETKYAKAIHAIAPVEDDGNNVFVIFATGDEVTVGGRKRLTWADLVEAKNRLDKQKCKKKGRRLVLCPDHVNDLLLDNSNKYADKLADYLAGQLAGTLAGFQVFENINNPMYSAEGVKNAYGAIGEVDDLQASVFFHPENVVKKTGLTKQYFAKSDQDPENQTNRLNYRHYFIATKVMDKYAGAIL